MILSDATNIILGDTDISKIMLAGNQIYPVNNKLYYFNFGDQCADVTGGWYIRDSSDSIIYGSNSYGSYMHTRYWSYVQAKNPATITAQNCYFHAYGYSTDYTYTKARIGITATYPGTE